MTIIGSDGKRLDNSAWSQQTTPGQSYNAYVRRCREGNAVPLDFREWAKIQPNPATKNDWNKLQGCRIESVTHEGDLEWAKQNGLENCIYLITDKGTVTLDIGVIDDPEDLANGQPYITVNFSW